MSRPVLAALVALATNLLPQNAPAQSSLGLNFAEAEATLAHDSGATRLSGHLMGDYRISAAHGLQFGLTGYGIANGWVGQVDAHLYLQPQADRKYGFYLTVADIDSRAATMATGGVEAMWQPGTNTTLTASAGAGLATGSLDFLTVSGSADHALSDRLSVFVAIGITVIDEADISATAISGTTGIRYALPTTGIELTAALAADRLAGYDSGHQESRVKIGVAWRFGAERGARRSVNSRSFETMQPLDALITRGLF